jgi:hypothetical protein
MNTLNEYKQDGGMDGLDRYIADSIETEKQLPELLTNREMVVGALQMAVAVGAIMDIVKRLVIYGKPFGDKQFSQCSDATVKLERAMMRVFRASAVEAEGVAEKRQVTVNPRLLHALIGIVGECGRQPKPCSKRRVTSSSMR